MKLKTVLIVLVAAILSVACAVASAQMLPTVKRDADGHIVRSGNATYAFRKISSCPYKPEEGCIIDHVIPLCIGGPDVPANMQWQSKAESLKKDKYENQMCKTYKNMQAK